MGLKKYLIIIINLDIIIKASPEKLWTSGVAVNMPPCHGGDREFDSRLVRHQIYADVVQW